MRTLRIKTLPLLLPVVLGAAPPQPTTGELIARHSHAFSYDWTGLAGPGAEFLRRETERAQFVLLGEQHMDHEVPRFAGGLFAMLRDAHGFGHLVVEQDPVAMEDALAPGQRGAAEKLAAHAARYPSLFEFDSDEDLELLARVGRLVPGTNAIWGVEQATGAIRYLEELAGLAPSEEARRLTDGVLAAARAADPGPKYSVNWLADPATAAELEKLQQAHSPPPGSRAERLLSGLRKSAEIFGYYTRAQAGEFVGLYNNTVREEVLKANFLRRYHAAARPGMTPRALFKFGSNHLYRGRNPTQAFPIGNLAHEFAIANGAEARGLYVQPLGPGYVGFKDLPPWLAPFLPETEPVQPWLLNLRELRRFQRLFREKVPPAEADNLRTFLHGYDVLVLLPNSQPAAKILAGRPGY